MKLETTYLGLRLRTPLVVSASPLSETVDQIRRLEDSGAAAVVLYSLFEEQIRQDRYELHHHLTEGTESFAEALTYFPEPSEFKLGPEGYLEHIAAAKRAVRIPVIASLNGSTAGGWVEMAKQIEQAGADALELNIYFIPTDPALPGSAVEDCYFEIARLVREQVGIPVAVKLSPFFSNLAHVAGRLVALGIDGLVLFNRFYQPDIDLESLEVRPNILYSTPMAMRLPLRWIAMLRGRIGPCSLAATSGIHRAADAVKMLLAGADATMLCSVLLRRGIAHLKSIEQELALWLEEHEYESVEQLKGSLSQEHCPEPSAFERAQYMKAISTRIPIT